MYLKVTRTHGSSLPCVVCVEMVCSLIDAVCVARLGSVSPEIWLADLTSPVRFWIRCPLKQFSRTTKAGCCQCSWHGMIGRSFELAFRWRSPSNPVRDPLQIGHWVVSVGSVFVILPWLPNNSACLLRAPCCSPEAVCLLSIPPSSSSRMMA